MRAFSFSLKILHFCSNPVLALLLAELIVPVCVCRNEDKEDAA
jgi:hypothetical protein